MQIWSRHWVGQGGCLLNLFLFCFISPEMVDLRPPTTPFRFCGCFRRFLFFVPYFATNRLYIHPTFFFPPSLCYVSTSLPTTPRYPGVERLNWEKKNYHSGKMEMEHGTVAAVNHLTSFLSRVSKHCPVSLCVIAFSLSEIDDDAPWSYVIT